MAHEFEQEIEVLGRKLTARYTVAPAEPDVGIMSDYVDDIWFVTDSGRRDHSADAKMSDTDWENLTDRIMENHDA